MANNIEIPVFNFRSSRPATYTDPESLLTVKYAGKDEYAFIGSIPEPVNQYHMGFYRGHKTAFCLDWPTVIRQILNHNPNAFLAKPDEGDLYWKSFALLAILTRHETNEQFYDELKAAVTYINQSAAEIYKHTGKNAHFQETYDQKLSLYGCKVY